MGLCTSKKKSKDLSTELTVLEQRHAATLEAHAQMVAAKDEAFATAEGHHQTALVEMKAHYQYTDVAIVEANNQSLERQLRSLQAEMSEMRREAALTVDQRLVDKDTEVFMRDKKLKQMQKEKQHLADLLETQREDSKTLRRTVKELQMERGRLGLQSLTPAESQSQSKRKRQSQSKTPPEGGLFSIPKSGSKHPLGQKITPHGCSGCEAFATPNRALALSPKPHSNSDPLEDSAPKVTARTGGQLFG